MLIRSPNGRRDRGDRRRLISPERRGRDAPQRQRERDQRRQQQRPYRPVIVCAAGRRHLRHRGLRPRDPRPRGLRFSSLRPRGLRGRPSSGRPLRAGQSLPAALAVSLSAACPNADDPLGEVMMSQPPESTGQLTKVSNIRASRRAPGSASHQASVLIVATRRRAHANKRPAVRTARSRLVCPSSTRRCRGAGARHGNVAVELPSDQGVV